MTTHRFEVTPVNEYNRDKVRFQSSEIIPLINIEKNVPAPPPMPSSFTSINERNKPPIRLINSFIQRLKTDSLQKNITSSFPLNQSSSSANFNVNEEVDSCSSTIHANDTNSLRLTNKFLHELRSKRREFHEKARHLSIDQRIALNRFQYDRNITRAQDIFDIHFTSDDDDANTNMQYDIFNEIAQERIRNNIFNELDRQRIKQFHKQHRQLVLGRALLMFMTSVILFMGVTLIYVVIDLYDRANDLDKNLGDFEYRSMSYDDATDV